MINKHKFKDYFFDLKTDIFKVIIMTSKTCPNCIITKPLSDFYKAGDYYQSLCKPCHNSSRKLYDRNYKKKTKKVTGFKKLSEEKQSKIIEQFTIGMSAKDIAYENNLNYNTLLYWKRTNQIISKD